MNIQPLGDRILVETIEAAETTKGGIIIPDVAKEKPQEAIVTILGTGADDGEGGKIPFEVKVGDKILVAKYGGTEIKLDGKLLKIFASQDIIAIIE